MMPLCVEIFLGVLLDQLLIGLRITALSIQFLISKCLVKFLFCRIWKIEEEEDFIIIIWFETERYWDFMQFSLSIYRWVVSRQSIGYTEIVVVAFKKLFEKILLCTSTWCSMRWMISVLKLEDEATIKNRDIKSLVVAIKNIPHRESRRKTITLSFLTCSLSYFLFPSWNSLW